MSGITQKLHLHVSYLTNSTSFQLSTKPATDSFFFFMSLQLLGDLLLSSRPWNVSAARAPAAVKQHAEEDNSQTYRGKQQQQQVQKLR